jgi:hypothetical protein
MRGQYMRELQLLRDGIKQLTVDKERRRKE